MIKLHQFSAIQEGGIGVGSSGLLDRLTLSQRLGGLGLLGVVLTCAAGAVGYRSVVAQQEAAEKMQTNATVLRTQMDADMMHDALRADVVLLSLSALKKDKEMRADGVEGVKEHGARFVENIKKVKETSKDESVLKAADSVAPKVDAYVKAAEGFADAAMSPTNEMPSLEGFQALFGQLEDEMEKLGDVIEKANQVSVEQTTETASSSKRTIGLISLLAMAIAAIVSWLITQSIRKPISEMSHAASEISQGNVNQTIRHQSSDEIGVLATSLRDLIDYIGSATAVADAMSRGDLSVNVAPRSSSDLLLQSFERMKHSLKQLIAESQTLIDSARAGRLNTRGSEQDLAGAYCELVQGMTSVLAAVSTPITEAKSVLEKVKQRDLTVRMQGHYSGDYDVIKTSLNSAVEDLESAISEVAAAAEQVSSASNEITSGSQRYAHSATTQASSLDEVTNRLQEITTMSKQNATNSQNARTLAEHAREAADKGSSSMERLSNSVDEIKKSADETAKIVKTIDEIAFQTNLLALNAAVEAARAGDAGRGFAVVAEEVRNLAMRSADAARNTAQMIQESVRRAEEGVLINQEATQSFMEIRKQVNQVLEVMSDISTSSHQQSDGVARINAAVEALSLDTQANASTTEQTAAASTELSEQAAAMKAMTTEFKVRSSVGRSIRPKSSNVSAIHAPKTQKQVSLH